MAETDWTVLTDSEATTTIARGVTSGVTPPNGGGTFVHGFNSLAAITGASGLFTNQANFAPMSKGARITGALQRASGGAATGFAPMLYVGLQGPAVGDSGYLLGLSDASPTHVVLRKGAITGGLPENVGSNGVLAQSTVAKSLSTWYHLRLDMVVNDNGDVVLNVFENDLTTNPVTSPVWNPIAGMDALSPGTGRAFIDDALGVNSGSAPFTSGRGGFAFEVSDISRRGFFDHISIARQL